MLKGQTKEEIIEIFLGVLDQQVAEKNELSMMIEILFNEAMVNLKKVDSLVGEIILLEAIIEDILGLGNDEKMDTDAPECNCEGCPVKDICKGLNDDIEEKEEETTVGRKPKAILVSHPETGYTEVFPSLQTASETLKVSIGGLSEVANGKRDSIKGYIVTFL